MSEETKNTTAGETPALPPTPASVARHLSVVQIIAIVIAVMSAVLTGLQAPQFAPFPWVPPVIMILSLVTAALMAGVKAYNVPVLLLAALLAGLSIGGCAPLPANPTPSAIVQAQNDIGNLELGYVAITAGLDLAKLNDHQRALVTAAEDVIWTQLEKAYAAAGRGENIDRHDLVVALDEFKKKVRAIQRQ